MAFLELADLVFRYPGAGASALDGCSLAIEQGEFVALVGPNGAGKSTLARLVKGLLIPEQGEVRIGGRTRPDPGLPDPRVGLLFSNPENQLVTSVVEEDVAFGLEALALPPGEIRRRVDEVLGRFGLLPMRRELAHRLSGGEQQRVALAGVLAPDPGLLVLDEPTAFLDPAGKEILMASLGALIRGGKTILLITHEMEEAALADRVVLLASGKVVSGERPAAFFRDPGTCREGRLIPPFGTVLGEALRAAGISSRPSASWEEVVGSLPVFPAPAPGPAGPIREGPAKEDGVPLLEARAISFSYGRGEVLSGCGLSLPPGESALLVGPNGSGKSTLLLVLAGLLPPGRGEVLFAGAPLTTGRNHPPQAALVFQHPERALFGETVAEDIAFGPRNLGVPEREVMVRVAEAAERVGLSPDLLPLSPFHLSGGQQRRAALAGVLSMRPQVLLLDEPADGLDPASARDLMRGLCRLAREEGIAVLAATHAVPAEIGDFDRLLLLQEGRITDRGIPAAVLSRGALADQYLPPHLRARRALASRGYRLGTFPMDPEEAAAEMARVVSACGRTARG